MYERLQQRNMAEAINITSGRIGGGVFFERKRRKKSHRMVGQSVSSNCRNANQAGWFGQSVSSTAGMPTRPDGSAKARLQNTEVFTPCRFGRLSLPLRANVRVGPPAMSSSVQRFTPAAFLSHVIQ